MAVVHCVCCLGGRLAPCRDPECEYDDCCAGHEDCPGVPDLAAELAALRRVAEAARAYLAAEAAYSAEWEACEPGDEPDEGPCYAAANALRRALRAAGDEPGAAAVEAALKGEKP